MSYCTVCGAARVAGGCVLHRLRRPTTTGKFGPSPGWGPVATSGLFTGGHANASAFPSRSRWERLAQRRHRRGRHAAHRRRVWYRRRYLRGACRKRKDRRSAQSHHPGSLKTCLPAQEAIILGRPHRATATIYWGYWATSATCSAMEIRLTTGFRSSWRTIR